MQKINYLFILLLVVTASMSQADDVNWDELLTNPARSQENRARDVYRHPRETLEFFEIAPDQAVLEVWPTRGWYSEILAPMLKDDGNYSVAHFNPESAVGFLKKARADYVQKMASQPKIYDDVKIYTLEFPTNELPGEKFDRVVTFRNVHNWIRMGSVEPMFKAFYASLKPGGILGVVEHRAPADFTEEQQMKSGYVTEEFTIAAAKKAGFEFVSGSDINNNPKDTKDYPKGVWTLPPTLALGDVDKQKYLAIGESDRFTLKFRKPTKSKAK
jgi:predicted methyltransferase